MFTILRFKNKYYRNIIILNIANMYFLFCDPHNVFTLSYLNIYGQIVIRMVDE